MKKILFILFLLPMFTFGQFSVKYNNSDTTVIFNSDVIFGSGWQTWSPTLVWDHDPTTPTVVARYIIMNKTVFFKFEAASQNSSGSTITTLNVTLPETPSDKNFFTTTNAQYSDDSFSRPTTWVSSSIDMLTGTAADRKLYIDGLSILNTAIYRICVSGCYEID